MPTPRFPALLLVHVLIVSAPAHAQDCKWSWKALWSRPFALDALGCVPKAQCKVQLLKGQKCRPRGRPFASANASTLSEPTVDSPADALTQTMEPSASSELEDAVAAGEAGGCGAFGPLVELITSGSEQAKEKATSALVSLAMSPDNREKIAAAGAIEPLVALLRNGSAQAKEAAAGALGTLAISADNQAKIAAAGAIKPLVALLRRGSAEGKGAAALALTNMAGSAKRRARIAAAGAIDPLVALQQSSGSAQAKEWAASALGLLAYDNEENQAKIADARARLAKNG